MIALAGGSMHSVSGPTAAFVVILALITARNGLSGLLVATLMAGVVLVAMGLMRLGRLIQFIPHPVTTGFTAGIAVVIAVLQLGDLVGIGPLSGDRVWERLADFVSRSVSPLAGRCSGDPDADRHGRVWSRSSRPSSVSTGWVSRSSWSASSPNLRGF